MVKIITLIKRRTYPLIILFLVLVLAVYLYASSQKKPAVRYFNVVRGAIISEIGVTGTIKPPHSLDLKFQTAGRIRKIYARVGDQVSEGTTLAVLDNSDVAAELAQAGASVAAEQATLDQLRVGTKPEDIEVERSRLAKAEQDLANYYSSVSNLLYDAYAKANDAVRQQTDALFTNSEQDNPYLTFQVTDFQIKTDAEAERYTAGLELNSWQKELATLESSSPREVLDQALLYGENHLSAVRRFLYKVREAVQNATNISASTLTTYKTYLNDALSEVTAALTSLLSQKQDIASQKITVEQVRWELNSKLAGNLPEQINAQAAKLEQAKANAAYYEAQLAKTILFAPFAGIITRVVPSRGDVITTADPIVSLIGNGTFQIEANIAESDITRIKLGNPARVTLDAYGPDSVFSAKVVQIDLSSTIVEGVATYKTVLEFNQNDPRILAGLTANVSILSGKKEDVLYVPSRDISTEGGGKFVNVLVDEKNNAIQKTRIETGLRGSEGTTEVIS